MSYEIKENLDQSGILKVYKQVNTELSNRRFKCKNIEKQLFLDGEIKKVRDHIKKLESEMID